MLIEDIKDRVIAYFNDYKDTDFRLLVEFTKDAAEESIISDIRALKEVLG